MAVRPAGGNVWPFYLYPGFVVHSASPQSSCKNVGAKLPHETVLCSPLFFGATCFLSFFILLAHIMDSLEKSQFSESFHVGKWPCSNPGLIVWLSGRF